jgi:hypothetical protein
VLADGIGADDHEKARVMRKDLLDSPHCLWCGASIARSKSTYYCSAKHSDLQAYWACRQSTIMARPCPTPRKRVTRYRGTALRWAICTQKYPYRCQCGFFHLTSKPMSGKPYEKSLAELANALHLPWPNRKARMAEYKTNRKRRLGQATGNVSHPEQTVAASEFNCAPAILPETMDVDG